MDRVYGTKMTDPMNFHDVPEDVLADEEAARRLEHARLMLERARGGNSQQRAKKIAAAQEQVLVSIAPGSGVIRRNGPCPCGSKKKFKKCCLGKVRNGELEQVKHSGGDQTGPRTD